MPEPYVGEIRMFAGNFPPNGWMFCDGATLPISENDVLFQLIGTTYGGDGQETFDLPDLRGRLPLHQGTDKSGNTYTLGQNGGVESVTLTTQQIPNHNHAFLGSTAAGAQASPNGNVVSASNTVSMFKVPPASPTFSNMAAQMLQPSGGSQPHENLQPYLGINFIISLFGVFPQQS